MPKSKDTIKLSNSDTVRLGDEETVKSDETVRLSDQTEKIGGKPEQDAPFAKEVIKSGFGNGIHLGQTKGNLYKFNEKEYRLIAKISESTSEAQIYLIERNAKQFVLKYYYPFVKPKIEIIDKLRKFSHPDIISVLDYGYFEDRFFEILDYADEGSLAEHKPIGNVNILKKFIAETVNALNYCHENGIIHRDVKPSNIFIRNKKKNDVLLGDFGIASLFEHGEQFRRTNIFQTPIYAAPEYRMNLRGETLITKAVDYYALGITIWELFSGQIPPEEMDDLEFLRRMFEGDPPLPAGMNEEIAYLIKGLTQRDHKIRWGYDEVQKWLTGDPPEIQTEDVYQTAEHFEFGEESSGKSLTASTPEELAELIRKFPDLGRKNLYRGAIKEWLKKTGRSRLFVEIADITDYKFENDEETGASYAKYILDKNFPYYSIDEKPCRTKRDIIDALDRNIGEYTDYFKNENNELYLFLLSKNAVDEVAKYRSYYKKYGPNKAIYYVIYDLRFSQNPNVAYYHPLKEDPKSFDSLTDFADYLFDHPDQSSDIIQKDKFWVWLNFKNIEVYEAFLKAVKKYTIKSQKLAKLLPYILDPERGYEGLDGNMCRNLYELGKEFDDHFHEYKKILKDKNSKIYTYFEMKGYTGEIEFCQEVFNMKDAEWRDSPYNDNIAMMKIIRGFGWTPVMNIKKMKNGKTIDKIPLYKPEDLVLNKNLDKKNIIRWLNKPDSVVNAWLSIFFHEYPLNDEDTIYMYGRNDFDERLEKYLEFISDNFPETDVAERYNKALKKSGRIKKKFIHSQKGKKILYYFSMLSPITVAAFILAYSFFSPSIYLPKNVMAVNGWYYLLFVGGVIVYFIFSDEMDVSLSTAIIGGGVIGIIGAIIVYYLFYLILSTPLLLLLAFALGYWFYYITMEELLFAFNEADDENNLHLNSGELNSLVFQYAFGKIDKISIGLADNLNEIKKDKFTDLLAVLLLSGGVTLVLLAILLLLLYHDPYLF